jgi:hypothetical protein
MPTGFLRPSSATAIPVKPIPVGKFSEYDAADPLSNSGMPIRPATAPDSNIAETIILLTEMPLATAAVSDRPVALMEKPKTVRDNTSA